MKVKLMAWICIISLLMSSLVGCAAQESSKVEMQAEEMIETTEATEPQPDFYEENGIVFWEGFSVEESADLRETYASAEVVNIAKAVLYRDAEPVMEILNKELVNGKKDIHITKYYPEEFDGELIEQIVEQFYHEALSEEPELTKDIWLENHKDYVLYNYWQVTEYEENLQRDSEVKDEGLHLWESDVMLLDGNSGKLLEPRDESAAKFPLMTPEGTAEIYVIQNYAFQEEYTQNGSTLNGCFLNFFVMAPCRYSGLSFVTSYFSEESMSDEEMLKDLNEEEEETGWEQLTHEEYVVEHKSEKRLYCPIIAESDRDLRPAPAATFLARMGLDNKITYLEEGNAIQQKITGGVEILYHNTSQLTEKSFTDKGVSDTTRDIFIKEYAHEQFTSEEINDVIEQFWRADSENNPEITKEQWLEQQKNNKFVHFYVKNKYKVAAAANSFLRTKSGHYWWNVYYWHPMVLDSYTGTVYGPNMENIDHVNKLSIQSLKSDISVLYKNTVQWENSSVNSYNDFVQYSDVYALVPADYDGLVLGVRVYGKARTYDAIMDMLKNNKATKSAAASKEIPNWWGGNYVKYGNDSYVKNKYYALTK